MPSLIQKIKGADKTRVVGATLVSVGGVILISIYLPIILLYLQFLFKEGELKQLSTEQKEQYNDENLRVEELSELFVDKDFGIFIPKIDANAKVIQDVNPYNEQLYNSALKDGIAHASGTSLPGKHGNSFLFAHSAVHFYDLTKYNVNFFLLNKLEKGDQIYTSVDGEVLMHEVEEVSIVTPDKVEYLSEVRSYDTVTLMSCWPAGTDFRRIVVVAKTIYPIERNS